MIHLVSGRRIDKTIVHCLKTIGQAKDGKELFASHICFVLCDI